MEVGSWGIGKLGSWGISEFGEVGEFGELGSGEIGVRVRFQRVAALMGHVVECKGDSFISRRSGQRSICRECTTMYCNIKSKARAYSNKSPVALAK